MWNNLIASALKVVLVTVLNSTVGRSIAKTAPTRVPRWVEIMLQIQVQALQKHLLVAKILNELLVT